MKQYKVKGRFEFEFEGKIKAEDDVQAELVVATRFRTQLEELGTVIGRPYKVNIEEVSND